MVSPLPVAAETQAPPPRNPLIHYGSFIKLAKEVEPIRQQRRVAYERFMQMAKEDDTILLDTRSKAAYDQAHLKGAVHLNFSEFTAGKLARVIPTKTTRVLIYCNNNFDVSKSSREAKNALDQQLRAQRQKAFPAKRAPLALNIPTFINLYGYGYRNLYELADVLPIDDPRLTFASN